MGGEQTGETRFILRVTWRERTAAVAEYLWQTKQRSPIVERAAVALAALLFAKLIPGGEMRVTRIGERADYWLPRLDAALELAARSGCIGVRALPIRAQAK